MTTKLSAEQSKTANAVLNRLDKMASAVQENHKAWGMSVKAARELVNELDKVADDLEKLAYGEDSLERRQIEVLKTAKVFQSDKDEPYMSAFANPMAPVQTEGDEPYMSAYNDDQSSAVRGGKDSAGKPLTSHS